VRMGGGGAAWRRHSELSLEEFQKLHASTRRGDIIGVTGFPGATKRGELSLFPRSFQVRLAPPPSVCVRARAWE
jgi:lysyl-tRNA synthetase class II